MSRSLAYERRRRGTRIRFALATRSTRTARKRRALLDLLWDGGAGDVDVLAAIQAGELDVLAVCRRLEAEGAAAGRALRETLAARERGAIPTFAAARASYMADYRQRRSDHGAYRVGLSLAKAGRQEVGNRALDTWPLNRIERRHVEAAIMAISDVDSTRESYRTTVSGLFTWHIAEEAERARTGGGAPRLDANPAALIEPWQRRRRVETASEDQVRRLLAAGRLYQRAYLRLFLHTGLRISELAHLRHHLDFDPETWTLRVQARPPDARCLCRACRGRGWRPKYRRSAREFVLPEAPAALRGTLAEYLALEERGPGDWLFTNPRTGGVWHRGVLERDFERLCSAAGVRYGLKTPGGITPHTFRHTAATEMLRAGVRESVVAAILGDTVQVVIDTYVHLTARDLADGISRTPEYGP